MVQNSKKEGLGTPLGDTGASQLIGVKKTSDLLEKITWGLIISLFVLTLSTSLFLNKEGHQGANAQSPNIQRAQETQCIIRCAHSKKPAHTQEHKVS